MNAKQARKLTEASKQSPIRDDEVMDLVTQITKSAAIGDSFVQISSGNLNMLKMYQEWCKHNGYITTLSEKYSTQGDDRNWGYVHLLTVKW